MLLLRFLWLSLLTNLRLTLSFRIAFFLTIGITILKQLLFLIAWKYFFVKYKIIQGWNFTDMLFMNSIVCFSIGFVESFFYGLKDLPRLIESNQLDTFLLQPKNIILNIALSKGDMSSFGEIVSGIILIAYSGYLINSFLAVVIILISSIFFMCALLIYLSCIAFFMRNSYEFIRELNINANIVASQPNAAYRGILKMITLTILPVAFLSYFPVEHLRTGLWYYLVISMLGTAIFFWFACKLFKIGLKRYESGNMIAYRY